MTEWAHVLGRIGASAAHISGACARAGELEMEGHADRWRAMLTRIAEFADHASVSGAKASAELVVRFSQLPEAADVLEKIDRAIADNPRDMSQLRETLANMAAWAERTIAAFPAAN